MQNINVYPSYRKLRNLREQIRFNHAMLSGLVLAQGLSTYSQRGEAYVRNIQSIIRKYHLDRFDGNESSIGKYGL